MYIYVYIELYMYIVTSVVGPIAISVVTVAVILLSGYKYTTI